eukprot:TRINITY_DN3224_c0_g3_i1.p1 TRINITY_DN3224_c0_g3~~TRINITY_DN3224_c0_g3_i1.p1  ORF type:complete len:307 (+),score=62.35 TRINITY_DN3224_c0_g3_i1:51-923(+)
MELLSPESVFTAVSSPPSSPATPDVRVMERSTLLRHAMSFMGKRVRRVGEGYNEPGWLKGIMGLVGGMVEGEEDWMLDDTSEGLVFESLQLPPVSMGNYCWLLWLGMGGYGCGDGMWVSALVLLRRFLETGHTPLTAHTVHRLLLTSVVVAAKLIEDCQPSNKCASVLGGVDLANLNLMEATFIRTLNFELYVSPDDYSSCLAAISLQCLGDGSPASSMSSTLSLISISDGPSRAPSPVDVRRPDGVAGGVKKEVKKKEKTNKLVSALAGRLGKLAKVFGKGKRKNAEVK